MIFNLCFALTRFSLPAQRRGCVLMEITNAFPRASSIGYSVCIRIPASLPSLPIISLAVTVNITQNSCQDEKSENEKQNFETYESFFSTHSGEHKEPCLLLNGGCFEIDGSNPSESANRNLC